MGIITIFFLFLYTWYTFRLKFGEKLSTKLKADHMQRIIVRFAINTLNKKHIQVHQAFVRFTHSKTGSQSVFVAELDSQNNYKLDMVCYIPMMIEYTNYIM